MVQRVTTLTYPEGGYGSSTPHYKFRNLLVVCLHKIMLMPVTLALSWTVSCQCRNMYLRFADLVSTTYDNSDQ